MASQQSSSSSTEMQRRFFSLPQRAKEELALSEECPVRGYFGKGGEDLDRVLGDEVDAAKGQKVGRQARKDNKEGLDMNGAPWSKPAGGFTAQIFGMPSQLPAEEAISGFEEVMHEYAGEMFQLARRLLSLMALVLGRPRGFFEEHITKPVATHRLLHYWPLRDLAREIGVGEHTDYGLLTLLKQDEVGGLQVLSAKDEGWVHCPPLHDAFVVNLGDMLGRWTGHHFKSTVHRVVNTSSRERFSVPFFLEPNLDTLIDFGALRPPREEEEEEEREERKREPFNGEDVRGHYGGAETAEQILERFYRASGQLGAKGQGP